MRAHPREVRLRPELLVLVGLAGACDSPPELISEREDFRLRVPGVVAPGAFTEWTEPYLVLEGTRMCPELACGACPDKQTCDAAAIAVSGAFAPDGDGCFVAQDVGEAVWTVGSECGAPGKPPDRVVVRVVAAADTTPRVRHAYATGGLWGEAFGLTAVGGPWPGDVAWPMKIVAESQVAADVALIERASGGELAWSEAADVTWTTTRGRPPIDYPGRSVDLVAFVGSEATASFTIGGHTWPLGDVVGVSADEAVSLEIAASLWRDGESEAPALARVIARDAEGALLSGMPVRWSVERGEIGIAEFDGEVAVLGDCRPPERRGGPREAVLRVRYGDLSASLTIHWQGLPEEEDPEWSAPAWCGDAGCDCRQTRPEAALWSLAALLLLRRRRRRAIGGAGLAVALAGCGAAESPVVQAKESIELGELPIRGGYSALEGGQSVSLGERSLWVFREPQDDDSPNAAATLVDGDGRDGLYPFEAIMDEEGYEREPVPQTAAEADFNQGTCGLQDCQRMVTWPSAVVHDAARGRVLIFYNKRILRERAHEPSLLEQLFTGRVPPPNEYVGTGIAVWGDDLAGQAERADAGLWDDEPTLLFRGPEPRVGAAALIDGEFLYSYACDGEDNPCIVARVPVADALRREEWRFLEKSGGWSDQHRKAEELFDGAATMSVHFSEYAGAYVAVYAAPRTASVVVRTAPRPEGPWSDAAEIHRPFVAATGTTVRSAILHPELAREGGAIDYLTYFDSSRGSLRLAEIVWE